MSTTLELRFERADRTYRPGDAIRGEVVVRADSTLETKGISVALSWTTEGEGTTASGPEVRKVIHSGSVADESAWPFELTAPPGPLSYEGKHLQVRWHVDATMDVAWAFDPKARERIQLLPPASPCALDVGPAAPGRLAVGPRGMEKKAIGGLAVAGLTLYGGAYVVDGVLREELLTALWGGGASVLALAFFYLGFVRNFLAQRRLGAVELDLPWPASPGAPVPLAVRFTPRSAAQLGAATAALVGFEAVERGSGKHRRTFRHEVWKQDLVLSTGRAISAGEPVALGAAFELPADAPCSFAARSNAVEWEVHVRLDLAGWPDFVRESRLLVLPPGCVPKEAP